MRHSGYRLIENIRLCESWIDQFRQVIRLGLPFSTVSGAGDDPAGLDGLAGTGVLDRMTSGAGGRWLAGLCGRTVLVCLRPCSIRTLASTSVPDASQAGSASRRGGLLQGGGTRKAFIPADR